MIDPIPTGEPSFIDAPRCADLAALEADFAVIGVPNGWPYEMAAVTSPSSTAPRAIREQSNRYAKFLAHFDWEFDGALFGDREVRVVDCGDVTMVPGEFAENSRRTTAAINAILDRGAIPIVLGGDHAIPIPVFRAYEGRGDMVIVQLDAHIDWRDERHGIREGLSSTMRRASEMPWVTGMAQIGLRGIGSARQQEVDDARAYGSVLVRAEEVHERGVEEILLRIPSSDRYYVTFDADGLDPAIAPGVNAPGFGGLTYYEATNLLRGVARKGRVVGFDFVEVVPSVDVQNLTSLLAARLTLNVMGAVVREGQVGQGSVG
jgi:agmatinase